MQFADALTLDAPRRTSDGFLAVRAKAARAGVYNYLASEVGAPATFKATDTVKIYRDAAEVFAADSVRSFIGRAITNDHPSQAVTAANWRDHARGTVMGAMRDGEYLAFDLVLMDKAAIAAVDSGKRELSNGYSCQLDWTPGTAPDGTTYDARQTTIRGNHVALVDKGRAGPECAIKDGEKFALCDANPDALKFNTKEGLVSKTITIDGLPVNLGDVAAVEAVLAKKDAAIAAADKALNDAKAEIATLTAEKVTLDNALADAKAASDPAALDKRVADRAALAAQAKAIDPAIVIDGKSEAEIRSAIVAKHLGDAAKDFDDAQTAAAFAVIAKDAKPTVATVANISPVANVVDAASTVATIRAARYA
jgi:hypothetical protein